MGSVFFRCERIKKNRTKSRAVTGKDSPNVRCGHLSFFHQGRKSATETFYRHAKLAPHTKKSKRCTGRLSARHK